MFKTIDRWLMLGASAALLVLMLITIVDVIGRGLLSAPMPGATELTELTLAVLTFLVYPGIALRGSHIVVDLLDQVVGPRGKAIQAALVAIAGGLTFAIVAWRLWLQGTRSVREGDVTGTLGIPIGYLLCWMAVMSGITAMVFLSQFRRVPAPAGVAVPEVPDTVVATTTSGR